MPVMGMVNDAAFVTSGRPFAKDVLSIKTEGPTRPQLTLFDLPELIQTETKA